MGEINVQVSNPNNKSVVVNTNSPISQLTSTEQNISIQESSSQNTIISNIQTAVSLNNAQSLTGVEEINGAYGILTLTGIDGIVLSKVDNVFYFSYDPTNLNLTGSNLQNQIDNLTGLGGVTGDFLYRNETGQFYPLVNPSGFITGFDTVKKINSLINDIQLTGLGNVVITNQGQNIRISGSSIDTSPFALQSNLLLTGSGLQSQLNSIKNGTGNFISIATSINGISGQIIVSGQNNIFVTTNGNTLIISGNDITGLSRAEADARYYAINNPSGYLTGINLVNYITRSETGQFQPIGNYYLASNPSGYITGINLSPYALVTNLNATGSGLQVQINNLNLNTGNYYLSSNPNGYITGSDNYALKVNLNTTGSNLYSLINSLESNTGYYALQSSLNATGANLNNNINIIVGETGKYALKAEIDSSGLITGVLGVNPIIVTQIGGLIKVSGSGLANIEMLSNYLQTGLTGQFYTIDNPSGFITTFIELDPIFNSWLSTGLNIYYTIDNPSGYITGIDLSNYLQISQTGQFQPSGNYYLSSNPSGYITGVNLDPYALKSNLELTGSGLQNQILNLQSQTGLYLTGIDLSSYATINNLLLTGSGLQNEIDNLNFNTGNYYQKSNPSGFITGINLIDYATVTSLDLTGSNLQNQINNLNSNTGSYYLNSNPSGYITGINLSSYLMTGQTGQFVNHNEINQSGFALQSNLSQTGSSLFGQINNLNNNTGNYSLTGHNHDLSYYPLTSNPSGYITGVNLASYVTRSETGQFQPTGNYLTGVTQTASFGITIDGGTAVITTGVKGYSCIPYSMTIQGWDLYANISGSIVIDIFKTGYASFPPTSTIAGTTEKPTLTNMIKNQNLSLTGWITNITAGDTIAFCVNSVSGINRANLIIRGIKN